MTIQNDKDTLQKPAQENQTKVYLLQNLNRFVEELQKSYKEHDQQNNFLQQQLDFLKGENVEATKKILGKKREERNFWRKSQIGGLGMNSDAESS